MLRVLAVVGAWAALAVATGCTAASHGSPAPPSPAPAAAAIDCSPAGSTTRRDLAYASVPGVDASLLSLDLTVPNLPARCPEPPVVVWVHGGGFVRGDKANGVARKRRWAVGHGWAFASVNHRLSPREPSRDPDRVVHPTHVRDVTDAVAFLVRRAGELGVDPSRLALAGHSAGAFLVALAGTDPAHLDAAGVERRAVVAVVALDTRYSIPAEVAGDGPDAAMYRNAFGTDPDVWRDASPRTHAATPGIPPLLVVTRGSEDRVGDARAFAAEVRAGGATVDVVDARPLDHAEVSDVLGDPDDAVVTPAVTDHLAAAFGG